MENTREYASPEQVVYSRWLDAGTKVGFVFLLVSFAIYVFGWLEPHIAHHELPERWRLPVDEYLVLGQVEPGWGWIRLVHRGDYLNLVGVAWLSTVTLLCFVRVLPLYWRAGDRAYAAIVAFEILVLAAAMSGALMIGH